MTKQFGAEVACIFFVETEAHCFRQAKDGTAFSAESDQPDRSLDGSTLRCPHLFEDTGLKPNPIILLRKAKSLFDTTSVP